MLKVDYIEPCMVRIKFLVEHGALFKGAAEMRTHSKIASNNRVFGSSRKGKVNIE